jgi:hypothetical protein
MVNPALIELGIPRSEKTEPEPLYVCPGCSNHTYSNNMIKQMQCSIKKSNISYVMTLRFEKITLIQQKTNCSLSLHGHRPMERPAKQSSLGFCRNT